MKRLKKPKVYIIKTSSLWYLLLIGLLFSLTNWIVLQKSGHEQKLRFLHLGPSSPNPRIIQYFALDIAKINQTTMEWGLGCENECGAEDGRGFCDFNECICFSGFGGATCSIGKEIFYGDQLVYHNLTLQPFDPSGWDLGGDLYRHLVSYLRPYFAVEIGVWKGASAIQIATALREQNRGILLAVDTWLPLEIGKLSQWHTKEAEQMHQFPTVFDIFLGNLMHLNLTEIVIPLPATSRSAYQWLSNRDLTAELIHIDGGHNYVDVEEDIRLWWKLLRKGGIMLGDDWSLRWPDVLRAVREHADRYHLDVHVYRNKWWIQKPR